MLFKKIPHTTTPTPPPPPPYGREGGLTNERRPRDLVMWSEDQWEAALLPWDYYMKRGHQRNKQTNRQTEKQTHIATTRPTRPRGPSWWKPVMTWHFFKNKYYLYFSSFINYLKVLQAKHFSDMWNVTHNFLSLKSDRQVFFKSQKN